MYEEIETAMKRLKKHKSPGIDDITGEMTQARREKVNTEECNETFVLLSLS